MEFKEPCFLYTPFQAFGETEEVLVTKGAIYCAVKKKDTGGTGHIVRLFEIELEDYSFEAIEMAVMIMKEEGMYVEGDILIPIILKDVINNRTILGETLPSHRPVSLGMEFDVRLA